MSFGHVVFYLCCIFLDPFISSDNFGEEDSLLLLVNFSKISIISPLVFN